MEFGMGREEALSLSYWEMRLWMLHAEYKREVEKIERQMSPSNFIMADRKEVNNHLRTLRQDFAKLQEDFYRNY